ncbi:MAG: radical SAM protein [Actinobacteria bacterium]|nr:radical SAM protein [Actinomycetota bacterium]
MRVLLINPPYRSQIIRRYVCSYNAPNFLFPPLELMYLSAQAKLVDGCEVKLMDCIASKLTPEAALEQAAACRPDVVLSIMAIEYFDNDIEFLGRLRRQMSEALVGCFGHLPSNHGEETLRATGADFVLAGEPDVAFRKLLERLAAGGDSGGFRPGDAAELAGGESSRRDAVVLAGEGVAVIGGDGIFIPAEFQRNPSLDELPYADQSAIDHSLYGEPFFGHPYTTFLSSRGCPFPCAYCVRTYGRKFVMASAEHVVDEVAAAVEQQGIRYFRFMDDTFTASRKRVLEICKGLGRIEAPITWSCLTRPNTIDGEVAAALRDAGCRRVYVGIESGSQKVLDYLKRGYKLEQVMDNLRQVRASGLEMVGWFIVGAPVETREDFELSLKLARELNLEFIAVSTLVPYPETELYEIEKDNIDFSLMPYVCQFKDQAGTEREAEFYRRYYLRPSYFVGKLGNLARHPGETIRATGDFLRYAVASRRDPNRKDLF